MSCEHRHRHSFTGECMHCDDVEPQATKCEHNRQTCRDSVVTCADCGAVLMARIEPAQLLNSDNQAAPYTQELQTAWVVQKPHKPGASEFTRDGNVAPPKCEHAWREVAPTAAIFTRARQCVKCGAVSQYGTAAHKPGAIEVLEQLVESNRRYQEYTGREQAIAISPTHAAELLELLK